MDFLTSLKYIWFDIALVLGVIWSMIKVAWPLLLILILLGLLKRKYFSKLIYRHGRHGTYHEYGRHRRHYGYRNEHEYGDGYEDGKTYIDENGYRRFSDSDKLVHRWVVENEMGRELDDEEVVHHKNRNKLDNRPDNLEVFPNQEEHDEEHGYYNSDDDYDYDDEDDDDY